MNGPNQAQSRFSPNSFAINPEPRCPVVLIVDTSGSMNGAPIAELNSGLVRLKNELLTDSLAAKRVEICIVSFPPVKVEVDFQLVRQFIPPNLAAVGDTPLGAATLKAIELIRDRKNLYKANGVQYFRPWIFLLTDGKPTDDWHEAARRVHEGEAAKAFAFFAIGVDNADLNVLRQISAREPLRLSHMDFQGFFSWLSTSVKSGSVGRPGAPVTLPPPGWSEI